MSVEAQVREVTQGQLIVITGPAAVGKSTVTSALLGNLSADGELWLAIGLDDFGRSLPRHWISVADHHGRYADRGYTYRRTGDGALQLELGADGRRVLSAFHRSVAAIVRSGVNIICEAIIFDQADWIDWSESLRGLPTVWVSLSAPVETLEAREKADRGPAFQGLARGMMAKATIGVFDIEADTATESAGSIARRIAAKGLSS